MECVPPEGVACENVRKTCRECHVQKIVADVMPPGFYGISRIEIKINELNKIICHWYRSFISFATEELVAPS